MGNFDKLIDEKLQQARADGQFDNSVRKGELQTDDDPFTPEDEKLSFHLLKNSGYAPAWIEDDKYLRKRLSEARATIAKEHVRYTRRIKTAIHNADAETLRRIEWDWRKAKEDFEMFVSEINKDIFNFNLRAPSLSVHRFPLRLKEEYAALGIA